MVLDIALGIVIAVVLLAVASRIIGFVSTWVAYMRLRNHPFVKRGQEIKREEQERASKEAFKTRRTNFDGSEYFTEGFFNCRTWNQMSPEMKAAYVVGYSEGAAVMSGLMSLDNPSQRDHFDQLNKTLLPETLSRGETIDELNAYCSDPSHIDQALGIAMKAITAKSNRKL